MAAVAHFQFKRLIFKKSQAFAWFFVLLSIREKIAALIGNIHAACGASILIINNHEKTRFNLHAVFSHLRRRKT